jgi:hypothetical protein
MLSYPSRGANHLKTVGLIYAKKTKEDACNPKVFENRSIDMPRKNETTISRITDKSKGRSIIYKGDTIIWI